MHRLPATTNRGPFPVLVPRDTVRVGDEVASIVFGAGAVWPANGGANSVPRIDPLTRGLTSFPRGGPLADVAVDRDSGAAWALLAPVA